MTSQELVELPLAASPLPERIVVETATATEAPAPTGPRPTLQMLFRDRRVASDLEQVHASAARGTATAVTQLPHLEQVQRSFGRHDVSGVQAHVGAEAAASAHEIRLARPSESPTGTDHSGRCDACFDRSHHVWS